MFGCAEKHTEQSTHCAVLIALKRGEKRYGKKEIKSAQKESEKKRQIVHKWRQKRRPKVH